MRVLTRFSIFAALLLSAMIGARAQSSSPENKTATGSISGRVTLSGQPAPGVIVILQPLSDSYSLPRPPNVKATTDDDGRYRLTGVAAGKYILTVTGNTFAVPSENIYGYPGKSIALAEGDTVEGIDLALAPGGVLTGRVTYAGGAPVINGQIELTQVIERGQKRLFSLPYEERSLYTTDDRGIYRIYGLPAGRYLVGVAEGTMGARSSYSRTFSPGVTDDAKATIIDVTAGGETSNVDIKLGQVSQGYIVSGRFVNGKTGQPLAIDPYGLLSRTTANGQTIQHYRFGLGDNLAGEFRLDGLAPGNYTIEFHTLYSTRGTSEFYSGPVAIEVTDHDITGLEIKTQRGASLSGVAVIEGDSNPATLAQLSQLQPQISRRAPDNNAYSTMPFKIGDDGHFRIAGLPPSVFWLDSLILSPGKGFAFLRTERDGPPTKELEVKAGEQVTGLRLIFTHSTGDVRGQVNIIGSTLPPGSRLSVSASRIVVTGGVPSMVYASVDARGQFIFENLAVGTYEVWLNYAAPAPVPGQPRVLNIKQTVTVSEGAVLPVTLTLDLTPKEKKQ